MHHAAWNVRTIISIGSDISTYIFTQTHEMNPYLNWTADNYTILCFQFHLTHKQRKEDKEMPNWYEQSIYC